MSELEPKPQSEFDQEFDQLMGGLDTNALPPLSVEEQKDMLRAIQGRHQQALSEAEVMRVVVDRMPESSIGNNPQIALRRLMQRHPSGNNITEAHISVGHWLKKSDGSKVWQRMNIPIALEQSGVIKPMKGFDQDQANLAMVQISELTSLKEEGILPGLSPNLNTINDQSTGLMSREK